MFGDPAYAPTTFALLKATIAPAKFTPMTNAPAISALSTIALAKISPATKPPSIIAPAINAQRLLLLR